VVLFFFNVATWVGFFSNVPKPLVTTSCNDGGTRFSPFLGGLVSPF